MRALLPLVVTVCLLPCLAPAQVVKLSGNVYDGAGGPLTANNVYLICNGFTVPKGQKLTIQKGTILKFKGPGILVQGTLVANGAIFSSYHDDKQGGDTNNNKSKTVPRPGDWRGIELHSTGTHIIDKCFLYYAGGGGHGAIWFRSGSSATVTNNVIRHSNSHGVDMDGSCGHVIANNTFQDCAGIAATNLCLDALRGFANNKASRCLGNYVLITNGTMTRSIVIHPRNSINDTGVLVIATTGRRSANINVPKGMQLTIMAGMIMKFATAGSAIFCAGKLVCKGTDKEPIVFTSIHDDTIAGDTNQNGNATQPKPGDWWQIRTVAGATPGGCLEYVVIRYAGFGSNNNAALRLEAPIGLVDCAVDSCANDGVHIVTGLVFEITRLTIRNNGGRAMTGALWQQLPRFNDILAINNAKGDYLGLLLGYGSQFWRSRVNGKIKIEPHMYPGPVIVVAGFTRLGLGDSLTLPAGCVVKFAGVSPNQLDPGDGSLNLVGTGCDPIVFTSIHDDSFGGDTAKDGSSNRPKPGDWQGIHSGLSAKARSSLEHVRVLYAGRAGMPAVRSDRTGNMQLRAVRVDHAAGKGFELYGLNGSAHNLVAYNCIGDGILAREGRFDLLHATIVACKGFGIARWRTHVGRVKNSIAYANGMGNYSGFTAADVSSSNGGLVAKNNNNINTDPQFVDTKTGNLHLKAASPSVDTAEVATATTVGIDHEENSRLVNATGSAANALPDMGAYERTPYQAKITGNATPGGQVNLTLNGPPGIALWLVSLFTGNTYVPNFGVLALGPIIASTPIIQARTPVPIKIPNVPALIGARAAVQAVGKPTRFFGAILTNRLRVAIVRPKRRKP